MPRFTTFVIEAHNGVYRLGADDGHGNITVLATFVGKHAMALFTRTLDHAKLAAHAHGQSGI